VFDKPSEKKGPISIGSMREIFGSIWRGRCRPWEGVIGDEKEEERKSIKRAHEGPLFLENGVQVAGW